MSDHVTSRRPPWRTVILGFLGITDLPIKVNCWYCSQDSYLLPGGKQTEHYWHCNICENTNVKDENGDIVDTLPVMYDIKLNRTVTPIQDTSRKFQTRRLCEACERNQALIYQIMSDYIRDENDPDYDYYVRTADDYKASLHQKYALCDNCQAIVDEIVTEQKAALRQRRFNEKLTRSLTTKAPRKPSKTEYRLLGLLWFWLHGMTWFICFYALWYPPIRRENTDLMADITRFWESLSTTIVLSTVSFRDTSLKFTFSQVAKSGLMFVIQTTWNIAQIIHTSTLCLVAPEKEESCQWDISNHAIFLSIICFISFLWMDWHPKASKTYFEESRIQRWGIYKIVQRFLYLLRFGLLGLLGYGSEQMINVTMEIVLVGMPLLLVFSVFIVKVATADLRLSKSAGTFEGLKRTYAEIQRFATAKMTKVDKESIEAARYVPASKLRQHAIRPDDGDIDNTEDEDVKKVTEAMMKKRSLFRLPLSKEHQTSANQEHHDEDGDMEGIVTGIHKIAFENNI